MIQTIAYTIDRYDDVAALMRGIPGVSLRDADAREPTARYLQRNPGLSFLAVDGPRVVGCALCGHDGRRGYLQHVAVHPDYRRQGVASGLVQRCLAGLQALGIAKVHIDVLADNTEAQRYWQQRGWVLRTDIQRYSLVHGGGANA